MHRRDNKDVTYFSIKLKGRNHLERSGIDARIIQKTILKKKQCGKMWDGQISFRIEPRAGLL